MRPQLWFMREEVVESRLSASQLLTNGHTLFMATWVISYLLIKLCTECVRVCIHVCISMCVFVYMYLIILTLDVKNIYINSDGLSLLDNLTVEKLMNITEQRNVGRDRYPCSWLPEVVMGIPAPGYFTLGGGEGVIPSPRVPRCSYSYFNIS
ncbi:hypothetical protein OTU49_001955 [Cherax quadricarinatus]|uniref:Uncharacterized protein n=1 Tax=Cherax quadricarinatus TaxID=27406 RepID=A0AAW0XDR2_CHEQU